MSTPRAQILVSRRNQRPSEKWLTLELRQGGYKVIPKYFVMPGRESVLRKCRA